MTRSPDGSGAGAMATVRARLNQQVDKVVVGQSHVVDATMIALAVGGHLLLEGPPGVAKTLLATAHGPCLLDSRRAGFSSRPTCCPLT